MHVLSRISRLATVLAVVFVAGCGGENGSTTPATTTPSTFTIGGSVTGLGTGLSVTLLDNGTASTVSANGAFTFPTPLATGATYNVTVGTQPSNQVCTVTNGSGTVGSTNVTSIQVACVVTNRNLAYVANQGDNTVSAYSINATTGALTPVSGSPFTAGSGPFSVTVNPAGTFAYVANQDSNNVWAYSINATTGALTPISGSPFTAGLAPTSVVAF